MGESPKVHYAFPGPGVPGRYPICGNVALLVKWHDDYSKLTCTKCVDRLYSQGNDGLPTHREIAQRLLGISSFNEEDDVIAEHAVMVSGGIKLR